MATTINVLTPQWAADTLPAGRGVLAAVRRRTPGDEAAPTATNWGPRPAGYGLVIAVGAAPAPADAEPGDLHLTGASGGGTPQPPEPGGTAQVTSFAGLADGSAWPQPWEVAMSPAGGAVSVVSQAGVLVTGDAGGWSGVDTVGVRYGDGPLDGWHVTARVTLLTSQPYARVLIRCDQAELEPGQQAIIAQVSPSRLSVSEVVAGQQSTIGRTEGAPHAIGTEYRVRVHVAGSSVRARSWVASEPEPEAWGVEAVTQVTQAGYAGLVVAGGEAAASQRVAWDDITVFPAG